MLKKYFSITLSFVLSFSLAELSFMQRAHAGMISTSEVVTQLSAVESRERINQILSRDDVKQELVKYGVSPEEASKRLASLSDEEVRSMAGQIDQQVAGGDVIVIGLTTILLIIIIVLLLR